MTQPKPPTRSPQHLDQHHDAHTGQRPGRHHDGQPEQRPNIVLFMTDDHAVPAIGAYGSEINRTPAVDRLAAEGMRFDNTF